jgi:DNA-binding NarL/FixJ family response regulator
MKMRFRKGEYMESNLENLRVLLVDDEELLLEGLEIILTFYKMKIVGMAHDGNEALKILEKEKCDLALVDLNMKGMGGIELIGRMKAEYPDIKILVLTTFYDDYSITQAIANGADGYLLKDSKKNVIIGAIEQIIGGTNVIDNKVMQRLSGLVNLSGSMKNNAVPALNEQLTQSLTKREKEICSLLALGYTNAQIAKELYISEGTVKNYMVSIYDKTGIHDRAKLVVQLQAL